MAIVRYERLSRPLAVLLPMLAIVGVGLPLVLGRQTFAILGLYLALPLTVGSLGYVFLVTRPVETESRWGWRLGFKLLVTGYAVCQAIAVVLLVTSPVRPRAYFVVVAVAAAVVMAQIVTSQLTPTRVGIVLFESAVLVGTLVGGVTFKYAYFFGRTDLFPHSWYATQLIETHHVTAAFENYQWFPLWHILAAIERYFTGLAVDPRYFFFLTNTIAYAVLVGGIYLLARKLFDSRRIALTASLLTSINTWVLYYGMYSIPRSLVSVLCVFTFVAMVDRRWWSVPVFAFLTVGIVVYHTVSGPFFLIAIGTVYIVQNVFGSGWVNRPVHFWNLLTVAVVQLGYWVFVAGDVFAKVIALLTGPSISRGGVGGTSAGIPNPVNELANYLQFSVLLLFVVVALVVGLRSERLSRTGKAVVVSGVLLAVVSFPGPTLLVGKLAANFNALRFGQYTFPLIVMAAAAGVVLLADADLRFRFGGPSPRTVMRVMAILLVLSLGFLAVSNDFVASDNPTVEREFYTYYMTSSETDGLATVGELSGGRVLSDEIACKYLHYSPNDQCTIIEADTANRRLLTGSQSDVIVVRTTELDRRGLKVYPTDTFDPTPAFLFNEVYLSADAPTWTDLDRRNKVFATDDVAAFTHAH